MSGRRFGALSGRRQRLALLALAVNSLGASAWGATAAADAYPAPRFPDFPAVVTAKDLEKAARTFVTRKGGGLLPGYDIKPGQKALILQTDLYEQSVLDAIAQVTREAGASVDIFSGDVSDIVGTSLGSRDWGYLENPLFLYIDTGPQLLNRISQGGGLKVEDVARLAALKKYDIVMGGLSTLPRGMTFRWEEIPWQRGDELLATALAGLPKEVTDKLYTLAWEQLRQARKVHMTDPEGTDITWTLPGYIATLPTPRFWREYMCMPERLKGNGLESAQSMREVDVNGVVAGTINHVGAFPQIKIYIRHNHVEKIEGGGRFGDEFRKVIAQYANTNWPGDQPKPGFGWIEECAIGVIPSEVRPRGSMGFPGGTVRERRRAGVFHWAFGAQMSDEVKAELEARNLPDGHFDVHNNFGTMVLETAAGKKIVFVDKGHMTVLDDPGLRELAAKYGNPDELLREQWIPAVPGINVPGDYQKDYAADPVKWIDSEYARFYARH